MVGVVTAVTSLRVIKIFEYSTPPSVQELTMMLKVMNR